MQGDVSKNVWKVQTKHVSEYRGNLRPNAEDIEIPSDVHLIDRLDRYDEADNTCDAGTVKAFVSVPDAPSYRVPLSLTRVPS